MDGVSTFPYTDKSFLKEPVPWSAVGTCLSPFDQKLRNEWDNAVEKDMFRYTLSNCLYKKLNLRRDGPLQLPCIAQLNPKRAINRRKRDEFDSMNDPFSEEKFNFKKIKNSEILLQISNAQSGHDQNILLNISPIEYGHVLLVPFLHNGLPQRCTTDSILLAFDTLELSSQPSFRLGFNSLHAWASVNHLHFHGMYCDYELFGDSLPAEECIISECYLLDSSSPLHGFVFKVPVGREDRIKVAKSIATVTEILHSLSIPYNIVINRGQIQKADGTRCEEWVTRTLIFPRKSSKGLPPADPFDVACIEVGGHFPVKTQESFDALTPEIAYSTLAEARLSSDAFDLVKDRVRNALE